MTEQPTDAPVGDNTSTETSSGNPAWQEILGSLPDSLHSQVRPALEKWDKNYESGIAKVHSQYEPYKPIIDGGFDPQTLQYALAVLDKIENDPKSIYDALAEHNGWAAEQGQPDPNTDEEYDSTPTEDPRLARAEQMSEAVAEYIMAQHQEQQDAVEDQQLDSTITSLQTQHGIDPGDEVADRFVMGLMLAGASPEQAFQEFADMTQTIATRPRANSTAPIIMGSGGGVPSSQIPVGQLNAQDRKALVAQMLAQANQD